MTTPQYAYKVTEVVKVTDGDTYWLRVDVGFRQEILIDCRLNGWDAPELFHPKSDREKAAAIEAKTFAEDFFLHATPTTWVQTEKDPDDFGRWLGTIWMESADGTKLDLGSELHAQGLASKWPTRWREEYAS